MKKLYRSLGLIAALVLAFTSAALAQRTVTGRVTDESGNAMPGVNVLIKGTSQGTATDVEGRFSLPVNNDQATIVITFVGYTSQEIVVGSRTSIDVQLAPDVTTLSELVITGYSEQRKRDITGAVAVVDASELNTVRAPTFGQKLAGRAPGITVSTSGQPGEGSNIRIRGISSISGNNDPLVIIDGVQIQGDKALAGLNPNDIETMQILKDASSASIYGARANAGVIIITTKQGKAGKLQVTYDGYVGIQTPVKGYNDILIKDPRDFARVQIAKNPNMVHFYGGDANNPVIPTYFFPTATDDRGTADKADDVMVPATNVDESAYNYPDNLIMRSNASGTDWWDAVFSPAPITEHNIGLSGGSENATFSASIGYMNQQGTMDYTYFKRYSARLNSRFTPGKKITIGQSLSLSRSEQVDQQGGNGNEQNTITQTVLMNTIVPVYDIAGNYAGAKTNGFSNAKNPVAFAKLNENDKNEDLRILGNVFGEYKIIEALKFRTSFSADFRNNFLPQANFPRYEDREVNSSNSYQERYQTNFNWVWTNTLEFNKKFADVHNLRILGGYEAVQNNFRQNQAQVDNLQFIDLPVRYLNLTYSTFNSLSSNKRVVSLASMFGKLDYEYNDKYLVSFTLRRDGTSDFLEDNRWGVFPAASVGWRISNEAFMQNLTFLSDLKLRAGWGITGNQNIPTAYNAYNQYGGRTVSDAGYAIGGGNTLTRGYTLYRYGNPDIKWEENTSMNIGLDASILDGKIGLVFDVYKRTIDDLIYNPPFAGAAGNAFPSYRNVASMENTGWDLGINYRGNITGDLGFNASLNLSHYRNEITKLDGEATSVFPAGIDKRFGEVNVWRVGYPISSFYGYTNDGIFQSQAELDAADAADGDASSEYQTGQAIGRYRRKDINKDGRINGDDLGVIGNPHPDLTLGLTLGLNYKNFDFTMFLYASIGNDIYNYNRLFTHFGQFNSNVSKEVLTDSWSESNPGGSLPKLDGSDTFASQSSTAYVEDGSYLRAQNVTLGYTLPTGRSFGIQSLRFYVQTQNLFTITGYSGLDPALSNVNIGVNVDGQNQNDGWTGYDLGNYPSSRSFIIGVNARF
ncbi:SusC/RagA family TonB-linked outer membrane protein [Chryseosolibacter indicus]|uniref:TonB-dependent receptor n=1 Tax=Chryseosolibacter indicus TaxID=2782351 RepID=A0ABS5VX25_9BACT|nr:TonB-dependent receptor [Chryseosolibacter indicus]MBT1704551.1 TonB-dependent receptor [Chryseosolibacter indicus]